jgi:phosphoglycolate phosphatase-like HAD superfamily hydrolase
VTVTESRTVAASRENSMLQAVIFDIDGTLVDSVDLHARAWQQALADFGHPVAFEEARQQIGKGGDQLLPVFLSPAELRTVGRQINETQGRIFKENYLPRVRPFPKTRELVARIVEDGKCEASCIAIYSDPADLLANYDRSPLTERQAA